MMFYVVNSFNSHMVECDAQWLCIMDPAR
jgi:hypothetical protein